MHVCVQKLTKQAAAEEYMKLENHADGRERVCVTQTRITL